MAANSSHICTMMPVGIQLDAKLRQELMVQCNTIRLQITVQTCISKCTSNSITFFLNYLATVEQIRRVINNWACLK